MSSVIHEAAAIAQTAWLDEAGRPLQLLLDELGLAAELADRSTSPLTPPALWRPQPAATNDEWPEAASSGAPKWTDGTEWLSEPENAARVWGSGDEILWSAGEPLLITGPEGVGKSTLLQQLVLARLGLRHEVLGFPVKPTERRVVYIAGDRPIQIRRSWLRMLSKEDLRALSGRLAICEDPIDLARNPRALADVALAARADTVAVDGLSDIIVADLREDLTGLIIKRAFAEVLRNGIDLAVLYHPRKGNAQNRRPSTLADVYGSRWITSKAGSVIGLWGSAGDDTVEFTQLKQPRQRGGPFRVRHDHERGLSSRVDDADDRARFRQGSTPAPRRETARESIVRVLGDHAEGLHYKEIGKLAGVKRPDTVLSQLRNTDPPRVEPIGGGYWQLALASEAPDHDSGV